MHPGDEEPSSSEITWYTKFTPYEWQHLILPSRVKSCLMRMTELSTYPHMAFVGPCGTGKTISVITLMESGNWLNIVEPRARGKRQPWHPDNTYDLNAPMLAYINREHLAIPGIVENIGYTIDLNLRVVFVVEVPDETKLAPGLKSRLIQFEFLPTASESFELKANAREKSQRVLAESGVLADADTISDIVERTFPNYRALAEELYRTFIHCAQSGH